jgi:hypothetical protein
VTDIVKPKGCGEKKKKKKREEKARGKEEATSRSVDERYMQQVATTCDTRRLLGSRAGYPKLLLARLRHGAF